MPNVSELEAQALTEFRKRVQDIVPEQEKGSDAYLLRWLRGRELDVGKAEQMFKKSLEWRADKEMDKILTWEAPEVLRLYYPAGLVGFDGEGCPVLIVPFGRADVKGLIESAGKDNFIRYTYQILEQCLFRMKSQNIQGSEVTQMVVIFDLMGLSLKQLTYRATVNVLLEVVRQYESNYPEILKAAYAVNAPKIFAMLFGIIRPMLTMRTLNKVQIFDQDEQKWKPVISKNIPLEVIPSHWGGTKTGNDEFCSSVVCMGGPVPSKYFASGAKSNDKDDENLITVTIPSGQQLQLEYEILISNSTMKWTMRIDGYDIGFSITFQDTSEIIPYKRIASQKNVEEDSVVCEKTGRYTLTFDNTYSKLRGKTLHYFVTINSPDGSLVEDEDNLTEL